MTSNEPTVNFLEWVVVPIVGLGEGRGVDGKRVFDSRNHHSWEHLTESVEWLLLLLGLVGGHQNGDEGHGKDTGGVVEVLFGHPQEHRGYLECVERVHHFRQGHFPDWAHFYCGAVSAEQLQSPLHIITSQRTRSRQEPLHCLVFVQVSEMQKSSQLGSQKSKVAGSTSIVGTWLRPHCRQIWDVCRRSISQRAAQKSISIHLNCIDRIETEQNSPYQTWLDWSFRQRRTHSRWMWPKCWKVASSDMRALIVAISCELATVWSIPRF